MLKAIIVDDEKLDRVGLQLQIDWKSIGIEIVGLASDGFEALELLQDDNIDILITDVKMPGMYGHELMEKAKKQYPALQVIFVSGYSDFNYVKKALQQEATEYILKPVDSNELVRAISRVKEKIKKQLSEQEEKKALLARVNEGTEVVREKLLRDIIAGNYDKEAVWKQIERWELKLKKGCCIASIIEVEGKHNNEFNIKNSMFDKVLQENLEINTVGSIEVVYTIEENGTIIFIGSTENKSVTLFAHTFRRYLLRLHKNLSEKLDAKVTMSIGQLANDISGLPVSYKDALQKMQQKMVYGKGKIFDKELMEVSDVDNDFVVETTANIVDCVSIQDEVKLNKSIDCLFEYLINHHVYKQAYVQDICLGIISRVQIMLDERSINFEEVLGSEEIIWQKLLKLDTIADIRQWTKNVLRSVIEYLKNITVSNDNMIVNCVIEEVNKSYMTSITLRNIADKLNYSPNHLGYIFKQKMGKGFNDFLIEYRMKKAKELLNNPKLKLYEVASMVSYKNMNAFTTQFKKYYGMTPKAYKNKYLKA